MAELAAQYEVNTGQIPAWKHPLRRTWLADSATIEIGEAKGNGALVARLYREIGQLKVERDYLAERSVHKYGAVTGNGCQHICMGVTWWKETYWEKGCIQLVFDRQGGEVNDAGKPAVTG